MKNLILLSLLLTGAAFAEMPLNKIDAAQSILGAKNIGPVPSEALVAHGLVDNFGNVVTTGFPGGGSAVLTPGTAVSFAPANGVNNFTLVPAQAETINAVTSNAVKGQLYTLKVTTSGTSSYTLTFGTNFTAGTLVTGTATGVVYVVTFVYDGTNFLEVTRQREGSPVIALVDATPIALGSAEGATIYTLTPAQTETINAAVVQRAGTMLRLIVTTSGASSFTLTFGTGFTSTGTLATGTSTAKVFVVSFVSNGTAYNEVSRTAAQ